MNKQQREKLAWQEEQLRLSREKFNEDWRLTKLLIFSPLIFLWILVQTLFCTVAFGVRSLFRLIIKRSGSAK
ncbi:MAG: hypothetical protein PHE53_12710 [Thermoguttaceae bacterium]|nr:hypothetical protein [Thermoguttaceae bacterium]